LLLLLYWPVNLGAQTAAETAWTVLKPGIVEAEEPLLKQCAGQYRYRSQPLANATEADQAIRISADDASLILDQSASITGHVEISSSGRLISADVADINLSDNQLNLVGQVMIREPGLLISGASASGDFLKGTGQVNNASFLLQDSGFRGSAEFLEKQSPTKIHLSESDFTQCDPGDNLWLMEMSTLNLDMDAGVAEARDVTVRIKDVPIFYLPYAKFPIDTQRHSGLLPPSLSKDSESGYNLTAAYYFNLATNLDASYTYSNIAQRGSLHQLESRFLTTATQNELQLGYINQDEIFAKEQTHLNPANRQNGKRWLISAQHTGQWQALKTSINYTALSDQDYLRELDSKLVSGADHLSQSFFSNDPYPRTKTALNQSASINWQGEHFSANLAMEGFQNLLPDFDGQYERQPELNLNYRNSTGNLHYYGEAQISEFKTASSPNINQPTSQRKLITSGISWPWSKPWGYAKPEIQVHHRSYRTDFGDGNEQRSSSDLTPIVSFDSGLKFEKLISSGQSDWLQTLEPRLFILHQGGSLKASENLYDTQQFNPSFNNLFRKNRFSGIDALIPGEQVSVALTSRLLRQANGQEILRVQAGKAFFHYDLPAQTYDQITKAGKSAIFIEASWQPHQNVKLDGKINWDTDQKSIISSYAGFSYRPSESYLLNLFHLSEKVPTSYLEYNRLENKKLTHASIAVPLSTYWRIVGMWNYDWNRKESIESVAAVEYNGCCWSAKLAYREFIDIFRGTEISQPPYTEFKSRSGIFIEFQLKGLGNIGSDLVRLLERTVPGFSEQH
jgi:LPS-assembly protein